MSTITSGNAITDAKNGWFVGSFFDPSLGLRLSKDVEVKWGIHKAGEVRKDWVVGEIRTSLTILISGGWKQIFRNKTVILSNPGDFTMWDQGEDHKWEALTDTTIITVRWPSIKQY